MLGMNATYTGRIPELPNCLGSQSRTIDISSNTPVFGQFRAMEFIDGNIVMVPALLCRLEYALAKGVPRNPQA
ncbi:uncharacterized protein GLRG_03028 [Colletotrichum graminicola M1.001]|uniref:Uncharacterized protein n=1 Tax=Colletotrichum graminicola (strain M1.001 / M2 / FGSC 10212) TaxID=645133 RepID=E3QAJ6_COLGM|nr:uncharacterized protein GLRG_03028 [Colletotrichum graminicola M1.001]EFQ27884.1 hypothetical protein GLRG_03028 [Colletotrichum graminicola M1.001]